MLSKTKLHTAVILCFSIAVTACSKKDEPEALRELTYTVSTVAGSGIAGFADGSATVVAFNEPGGVAIGPQGIVYVADTKNQRIRKLMPNGAVTTLAGTGTAGYADGAGASAQFNYPNAIAVDAQGTVYVADTYNNCIRTVSPSGVVSTLAGVARGGGLRDGPTAQALFNQPNGIAVDGQGNIYVGDTYNHRIRKISNGVVSTLAGTGPSGFVFPITPFADGPGNMATFSFPRGIAVDGASNLIVADGFNYRIRKITSTGIVSTVAGSGVQGSTDGAGAVAQFVYANSVAVDAQGIIYVADFGGDCIRRINTTGVVTTMAGRGGDGGYINGSAASARFSTPSGITTSSQGNTLYVSDLENHRIRKISGQ